MRVGDLARALRVTVGGTSKLVDRIASAGLIARAPDPDDRRACRVVLTTAGKRKLTAALKTYEAELTEHVRLGVCRRSADGPPIGVFRLGLRRDSVQLVFDA